MAHEPNRAQRDAVEHLAELHGCVAVRPVADRPNWISAVCYPSIPDAGAYCRAVRPSAYEVLDAEGDPVDRTSAKRLQEHYRAAGVALLNGLLDDMLSGQRYADLRETLAAHARSTHGHVPTWDGAFAACGLAAAVRDIPAHDDEPGDVADVGDLLLVLPTPDRAHDAYSFLDVYSARMNAVYHVPTADLSILLLP